MNVRSQQIYVIKNLVYVQTLLLATPVRVRADTQEMDLLVLVLLSSNLNMLNLHTPRYVVLNFIQFFYEQLGEYF